MYATALPVTPLPAPLGTEKRQIGVITVQRRIEED
jgi:leucyl-tRNA synthetase